MNFPLDPLGRSNPRVTILRSLIDRDFEVGSAAWCALVNDFNEDLSNPRIKSELVEILGVHAPVLAYVAD